MKYKGFSAYSIYFQICGQIGDITCGILFNYP